MSAGRAQAVPDPRAAGAARPPARAFDGGAYTPLDAGAGRGRVPARRRRRGRAAGPRGRPRPRAARPAGRRLARRRSTPSCSPGAAHVRRPDRTALPLRGTAADAGRHSADQHDGRGWSRSRALGASRIDLERARRPPVDAQIPTVPPTTRFAAEVLESGHARARRLHRRLVPALPRMKPRPGRARRRARGRPDRPARRRRRPAHRRRVRRALDADVHPLQGRPRGAAPRRRAPEAAPRGRARAGPLAPGPSSSAARSSRPAGVSRAGRHEQRDAWRSAGAASRRAADLRPGLLQPGGRARR